MRCSDIQPDLSALLDGELPEARSSQVRRHCAACSECATMLGELQEIKAALGGLPRQSAPTTVAESIREGASLRPRRAARRLAGAARWVTAMPYGAAAAVLLACIYLGWEVLRPSADSLPGGLAESSLRSDGVARLGVTEEAAQLADKKSGTTDDYSVAARVEPDGALRELRSSEAKGESTAEGTRRGLQAPGYVGGEGALEQALPAPRAEPDAVVRGGRTARKDRLAGGRAGSAGEPILGMTGDAGSAESLRDAPSWEQQGQPTLRLIVAPDTVGQWQSVMSLISAWETADKQAATSQRLHFPPGEVALGEAGIAAAYGFAQGGFEAQRVPVQVDLEVPADQAGEMLALLQAYAPNQIRPQLAYGAMNEPVFAEGRDELHAGTPVDSPPASAQERAAEDAQPAEAETLADVDTINGKEFKSRSNASLDRHSHRGREGRVEEDEAPAATLARRRALAPASRPSQPLDAAMRAPSTNVPSLASVADELTETGEMVARNLRQLQDDRAAEPGLIGTALFGMPSPASQAAGLVRLRVLLLPPEDPETPADRALTTQAGMPATSQPASQPAPGS